MGMAAWAQKKWILLFPLSLVLLFSSCLDKTKNENGEREIRISLPSEPPTLDWNLATDNVSYQILNQLMEGLTQFDENLNVIPAIAKEWEASSDGKTYTFHLDKNYRWSDGIPVTATHFRDSWIRLLQPDTAAEYAYFLFDIVGARDFNNGQIRDDARVGIHVIDPETLEVTLNKPVVFFPAITTFMVTFPIRKDLIEKYGDRWTEPESLKTCGPFALKEWRHEYRLRLEKNPLYGGGPKPSLDQILIFLVAESSTALALYETGQLDVVSPPPIALPKYRSHPDFIHAPKLRGYYYGFNIHKKPFDDPKVRRALAMALNKREIPNILKGNERPTDSWIPPGMFGFNDTIGLKFDPERAKELISNDCHSERGEESPEVPVGSFADAQGDRRKCSFPSVTLMFNSDPVNKKIAEWAASQWKKNLGIDVRLDNQEWKSYLSLLRTDPPPLFRLGWGADYPDPDNFMNLFTSSSGNNHTGWKNVRFDDLVATGAAEQDPQKRQALYDEAQKMLLEEEAVIIPLFVATQNILVKPPFRPFPLIPLDFVSYKRIR